MAHALRLPYAADPPAEIDRAIRHLERLAKVPSSAVVPPQCAYHALLRASSHCNLPEHSRRLFATLHACKAHAVPVTLDEAFRLGRIDLILTLTDVSAAACRRRAAAAAAAAALLLNAAES